MKRIALRILIGSVVASALLGIWALLSGDFDETQIKVLLTSMCISGASILSMACAAAWESRRWPFLPRLGMGLAIAGFSSLIILIWSEIEGDGAWKSTITLLILATTAAHISLVGLARMKPRHAWLVPTTALCATMLATLLIATIWPESDDENVWRWIGVLSILLSAFTILVPVFQRMGRVEAPVLRDRVRFCPGCGKALEAAFGDVTCSVCGDTYHVESKTLLPPQTRSSSSS